MGTTQRTRDLARAALLRERVLGAVRAAAAPMTNADFYGMSGIAELYHKSMLPQKVGHQLKALLKSGDIVKTGLGQYAINKNKVQPAPQPVVPQGKTLEALQIEVVKQDNTVSFTLGGVRITVKVL